MGDMEFGLVMLVGGMGLTLAVLGLVVLMVRGLNLLFRKCSPENSRAESEN